MEWAGLLISDLVKECIWSYVYLPYRHS